MPLPPMDCLHPQRAADRARRTDQSQGVLCPVLDRGHGCQRREAARDAESLARRTQQPQACREVFAGGARVALRSTPPARAPPARGHAVAGHRRRAAPRGFLRRASARLPGRPGRGLTKPKPGQAQRQAKVVVDAAPDRARLLEEPRRAGVVLLGVLDGGQVAERHRFTEPQPVTPARGRGLPPAAAARAVCRHGGGPSSTTN